MRQAPRFITQPSSSGSIVNIGQTKILQCQAIGYPQPEYLWLKDRKKLGEFTSEHFYRIQSVQKEDSGSYQCIARNSVGSIFSEKVQVSVAYMEDLGAPANQTVTVSSGEAAVFQLPQLSSYPVPSFTWQANDNTFLYGLKYALTSSPRHQLIILATEASDQKAYRARVTNTQLGEDSYSGYFDLQVRQTGVDSIPPQIIVPPSEMQVVKGTSNVRLECIANANECFPLTRPLYQLETLWFKDGNRMEETGLPYSFDLWNRTLNLISIDQRHSGIYKCEVKLRSDNSATVSAAASIIRPVLTKQMSLETLTEFGRMETLPCEAIGTPAPNISWFKDTILVLNGSNPRYSFGEDGSVTIENIEMADTGMWQCMASNAAGEASAATWLRVRTLRRFGKENGILTLRLIPGNVEDPLSATAPVWVKKPVDMTALDGKDATIQCQASGSPTPNATWIKPDGKVVDGVGRLQVLDSGDLLVAAVRTSDEGIYQCTRANEAGMLQATAHLGVLGMFSSSSSKEAYGWRTYSLAYCLIVRTQIIQPPVDTRVILGHVATLLCKVSSDPKVPFKITWFHDGEYMDPLASQRISMKQDGTLEIQEARASDVGEYACRVTSGGGNESRSAHLAVVELPYAPSNVKANLLLSSPHVANVSWSPGFDGNSEILKYIIQMRIVPSSGLLPAPDLSWMTALVNVSHDDRWALISGLQAAASYEFRVSALNSVGEGIPSTQSNMITLPPEPPSGPPQGLVGSARSPTAIMIQWQPPRSEEQNGRIHGYIIRYRLFGYGHSPWSYRNISNDAQRNYLIQELITFKDYEIGIAAFNKKGVGVFSESIRVKTREGVPEAMPTEVRVEAINSTAVRIWWKPPDPQKINGVNQGYKLSAWKVNPSLDASVEPALVKTVNPSPFDPLAEQEAIVGDLEKYMEYYITVLCFTNPGDGPNSIPVYTRTKEDVPEPVKEMKFENITDREVTVLWTAPEHANGVLLGYTLIYMVKDLPHTADIRNLTAGTLRLRITDLQAMTHYRFEIYAWTSMGRGSSKVAVIQSGVEPVLPDPPTKLAVSNIEAFSVVLQFTPGFDGNSSIIKWVMQAQPGLSTDWEVVDEVSAPDAATLTVSNLIPFTKYRVRLLATNIVGMSSPSEPTKPFQTIQAPPAHAPNNVTIRAVSATELRVRWIVSLTHTLYHPPDVFCVFLLPLQQIEWYGTPRGYNITYKQASQDSRVDTISIEDHNTNSYILDGLEEFTSYEIVVSAYNDVGASPPSPVAVSRTREAAPSEGPVALSANATSSTTVVVSWGTVKARHQNGIIEGYKVYYGAKDVPSQVALRIQYLIHHSKTKYFKFVEYKKIPNNSTSTTTLTELRKYTEYHIQVLAYTRVGDGVLSTPPVLIRTHEDVPGAPSNVSFPDVSLTMARIIWDSPLEPNGQILAYRVTYYREKYMDTNITQEFSPTARTYRATGLSPETYYMFLVTAKTNLGWGKTAQVLVYTTNNREAPQAPSQPRISQSEIFSDRITFTWTPGRDGFAPLRLACTYMELKYYTVQYAEGKSGGWQTIPHRIDPMLTTYTVDSLKPHKDYQFRIQATNDIGPSGWSPSSELTRTLPAAPSKTVGDIKVIPITRTSVKVKWSPLSDEAFNGDTGTGGYRIHYRQVTDFPSTHSLQQEEIYDIHSSEVTLHELLRDRNYEIQLLPFNSQGEGPASKPVVVYVGEAVPTGEPRTVKTKAINANQVALSWLPPRENQQNGDLLGYKIFYLSEDTTADQEEMEVVPASTTTHTLLFLETYTTYVIQIVAFNPAGDGPRSYPVTVKTLQGYPGAPGEMLFTDITMTSVRVTWSPPEEPNGEIQYYLVTYRTAEPDDNFSKEVKQRVSDTHLLVTDLDEEITYTFSVRAYTIGFGPPTEANITTGPQLGSPGPLEDLQVRETLSAFSLHWSNGRSGRGPILGYLIQSMKKDERKWETVTRSSQGPADSFAIPYGNLQPSTLYFFRVMAYNAYGISSPVQTEKAVATPAKAYGYTAQPPFYRQPLFLVILAAAGIVVIIAVVAVLCVKSKSYKYKEESTKSQEETLSMDEAETGFIPVHLRNSRRSLSKRASIASESDVDSERSNPHSFVNHYANVNGTLRQSWKRTARPAPTPIPTHLQSNIPAPVPPSLSHLPLHPPRNYSSYTDSEAEGSAIVSLNGGQIIMNNMAGSRAPLPGFSSFLLQRTKFHSDKKRQMGGEISKPEGEPQIILFNAKSKNLHLLREEVWNVWSKGIWPGASSDFPPMEHTWAILQDSVLKAPHPQNREDLSDLVSKEKPRTCAKPTIQGAEIDLLFFSRPPTEAHVGIIHEMVDQSCPFRTFLLWTQIGDDVSQVGYDSRLRLHWELLYRAHKHSCSTSCEVKSSKLYNSLLVQSMEKLRKSLEALEKRDSNDLPELYPELVAKTVGLKKTQEAWAKYHKLYQRHLDACDEEAKDEEEKAVVDAKHVEAEREKDDTKKNLELLRQQLEDLELKEEKERKAKTELKEWLKQCKSEDSSVKARKEKISSGAKEAAETREGSEIAHVELHRIGWKTKSYFSNQLRHDEKQRPKKAVPFHLDSHDNSKDYIQNYLWQQAESAHNSVTDSKDAGRLVAAPVPTADSIVTGSVSKMGMPSRSYREEVNQLLCLVYAELVRNLGRAVDPYA
ncbi:unnamed protein product [Darwinula stevensoni]|uniref:Protein sidekick n=1 Tax=Darwinula stevensoni TaxID=69355 RepID=A0A7R8XC84_9CRUS|nr:unnamed protein product [Darwinula stevensoni]CAG0892307.1 unnamed protein product [Darwinula stevensoni]